MKTTLVLAGSLLILCAANTACIGQDLVIYPADGQSQAAEQKAATYGKNREGYTRAQSACLDGRGYSAKQKNYFINGIISCFLKQR